MEHRMVFRGGEGEITEKKSRFIATVRPVKSEEEAAEFIEAVKKKYWDARHNCYIRSRSGCVLFSRSSRPAAGLCY